MMVALLHICCSRTEDRMRKFVQQKETAALSCPLGFLLHPDDDAHRDDREAHQDDHDAYK